jgi:elongator complex protein 1
MLSTTLDPALIEASANMTEFLADMKSQLHAQVPRLRELRAKKTADPEAFFEAAFAPAGAGDANLPDDVSLAPTDTTSGGTLLTRYTRRSDGSVSSTATRKTSKKKAREERKRARGKKGTVYEEEYLVNSIERLIERVNGMLEEVRRLVEGLLRRGMRERGRAVQMAVGEVLGLCEAVVEEFYEDDRKNGAEEGVETLRVDGGGEAIRPQGADATFWDSLQEVGRKRAAPVVRKFEGLSLLG